MAELEPYPIPDTGDSPLPDSEAPPQIPWERRKQIGRIRAYLQTAWLVVIDPDRLEQLLDAPVCQKHARNFRWVTFLLTVVAALVPLITAMLKFLKLTGSRARAAGAIGPVLSGRIAVGVLSLIGLFLAMRSLEWFSSPKGFKSARQDRAIALSCYVCAPILIVAAVGGLASLAAVLTWKAEKMQMSLRVINLAWLAVFLVWWLTAVRAIYFTTGRNARRTIVAVLVLPVIWAGQQLLVCFIPVSVAMWVFMSWSLL